jgi:steroid delta-isomerase-like uncharacterized protein
MDRAFLDDFVARYAEGWVQARDEGDMEGIIRLYTDDVDYHDPGSPEPIRGHEQLRAFLRELFVAFPDLTIDVTEPVYPSANRPRALLPFRMQFTMTGPWKAHNVAPTGRHCMVEGVTAWTFRGELASSYATYFDAWSIARQLGIVPPPDTLSGLIMARAQAVQARFQRRNARTAGPAQRVR